MASDTQPQKLGLALSGGGFRASYFHIGVLAQMAEQGLLRHVEVISTVSGGSIIGALYYLHVKVLLESKPDAAVTNQDYVELVKQIETDFKKATDTNIRMSTFADFKSNFRFIRPDYSRSDRISELYNDLIYQGVLPKEKASKPVQMRELKIFPPDQPGFSPRNDNAGRQAKVPVLIIHATSLNTGRDWHFNAQTMGEPIKEDDKGPIYEETDSKPARLRRGRPSYDELAPHQQGFELGHAVGASACVPALFPPLSISGLYQDGDQSIRVQLVDGGIYDNQGIAGLLYEDCTHFVVSDASKQLGVEHEPHTGAFKVLWRGFDSILPDRVRTESLQQRFDAAHRSNIAFMHLRKGLEVREIPWIDKDGKSADEVRIIIKASSQEFGVAPAVQEHLSTVRTDLDAFSEVEAYSLMLDGYLMSSPELRKFGEHTGYGKLDADGPKSLPQAGAWDFLKIAPWIGSPTPDYLRQLKVANFLFGKSLFLIPWLAAVAIGVALLLLVLLWPYFIAFLQTSIPTVVIVMIIGAILAYKLVLRLEPIFKILKILRAPMDLIKRIILNVSLPLASTFFVQFFIKFINPLFLKRGSVTELNRREPPI